MKRALIATMALVLAACATPPVDSPHATTSITLSQLSNGVIPAGGAVPLLVPSLPSFPINDPTGIPIAVPDQARSVNLASAILHVKFKNHMQVPLTAQILLSKTDHPYTDPATETAPVEIKAQGSAQVDQPVDPTMFKQAQVNLGVKLGTSGTGGQVVTISGSDALELESWVSLSLKLF